MKLSMILRRRLLAAGLAAPLGAAGAAGKDEYADARRRMLAEIEMDVRDTARSTGRERLDPRVAAAIGKVPRHRFVPPHLADRAYENRPLPIGHEQTISQPFIVALMTELIDPKPADRVLEIGTGSGYQAAVLAELAAEVYSIEIVEPLAEQARQTLDRLGYRNVQVKAGDGYQGWPEHAPFDSIIVTCAPERVPPPLVDQLRDGGKMIVPVGGGFGQELVLLEKRGREVRQRAVLPVRFVPMTGQADDPPAR